jgi:anti-sigma28 factor (negative regulator of flagellin synthesis)
VPEKPLGSADVLLSDVELKRLEDLRNAVTTGTYGVSAAEAAERLIEYMMQPSLNLLLLEPAIPRRLA